jgi:hypothetical protein
MIGMAVEVFNRYENKYLLDGETALWLQDRLAGSVECQWEKVGSLYV